METRFVRCLSPAGFHRMAYHVWGAAGAERTLVCVHGLTRNGRDFDLLAAALAEEGWRVVAVDIVGRGKSDDLRDPKLYGLPQYASDMATLFAALGGESFDFLGTSMGGLIGMTLAAQAGHPIRRLILNDVGAFIPEVAMARIGPYVSQERRFVDKREAEAHFRQIYAPFGQLTDQQWAHLTEHSLKSAKGGGFVPAYDIGIAENFLAMAPHDLVLWPLWDNLKLPVLLLRGEKSDLLPESVAHDMIKRGPKARLVTFENCGHAPALMSDEQITTVRNWLID